MSNSTAGSQRHDVSDKYQTIYKWLNVIAAQILNDSDIPIPERYEKLKYYLPAVWGVLVERETGVTTWTELQSEIVRFSNAQRSWRENGVPRSGTTEEWNKSIDDLVVTMAGRHIPENCDLFLDLGCGWGHRMFDLWRVGIAPRAAFYGGDRSDASRSVVDRVRSLFPGMRCSWFQFDFLNPDFSQLPTDATSVCIFSCHAIEQVNFLGANLFDCIAASFPGACVKGIHLEPVGFQTQTQDEAHGDADATDRVHAKEKRYNLDLMWQAQEHPQIEITAFEKKLIDSGYGNATALAVWERRTKAPFHQ